MHKYSKKNIVSNFRNLILYGLIGGFCASLDFCIFSILCHWGIMSYLWANIISTHIGIITSFTLNRSINFKVKDNAVVRFLSFYVVGLVGLGISELTLYIMVSIFNLNELICKIMTIILVAILQFLLNKYFTFRKYKK